MAKIQTRRSISFRRELYDQLQAHCATKSVAMSAFLDELVMRELGIARTSKPVRGSSPPARSAPRALRLVSPPAVVEPIVEARRALLARRAAVVVTPPPNHCACCGDGRGRDATFCAGGGGCIPTLKRFDASCPRFAPKPAPTAIVVEETEDLEPDEETSEPPLTPPLRREAAPTRARPKKCACCTIRFASAGEELCAACGCCVRDEDDSWLRAAECPAATDAPRPKKRVDRISAKTQALDDRLRGELDKRVRIYTPEERAALERSRTNPANRISPPTPATRISARAGGGNVLSF